MAGGVPFSLVATLDSRDILSKLQQIAAEGEKVGAKVGQGLGQGFSKAAQGSGQAAAAAERVTGSYTGLGRQMQTAANGLQFYIDATGKARQANGQLVTTAQAVEAGMKGVAASSATASGALLGLQAGLARIAAIIGVGALFRSTINAASELDTIVRQLSNTLGPSGAAGALQFLRTLSQESGAGFKAIAASFAQFTASASAVGVPLEQQEELFSAVTRAGIQLGLSNDALSGSFLALQQIAAKGVVQSEELRGQLGERLPIALAATAKGLGLTVQELQKLVESGKLTAEQFFPALVKGLNELTQSGGATKTFRQDMQGLADSWDQLQTAVGQNVLPLLTPIVRVISSALRDASGNADKLRESVIGFIQVAAGVGTAVIVYRGLTIALQAAAAAQSALAVASAVAQAVLNPGSLAKVALALGAGAVVAKVLGDQMRKVGGETSKAQAEADKLADSIKAQQQAADGAARATAKSREAQQEAAKAQNAALNRQLSLIGQIAEAEDRRGRAGIAAAQARLQVIDALVARENAYNDLQQSVYEAEIARAQARGASPQEIDSIEQRALVAQVEAAQRRYEVERLTLALKQQLATIEQRLAVNAAQRALAEAGIQYAQAVANGESADMLAQRREIYGLLEQQLGLEQKRAAALPALQQIERETLGVQEQATAQQLRAKAAAKGWEEELAAPLAKLQESADAFKALQNTNLRDTIYPATTAAQGLANAMWDAKAAAADFLQQLRAAAGIEPGRWAGGYTPAGWTGRVNELGQESFLSKAGDLSLITAPMNARWTAPTEGTVIPAAFTRVLKQRGMFDRISKTANPSPAAAPQRARHGRDPATTTARLAAQVAVLSQEVRALHRKEWSVKVGVRQREGAISFANRLAALR